MKTLKTLTGVILCKEARKFIKFLKFQRSLFFVKRKTRKIKQMKKQTKIYEYESLCVSKYLKAFT